MENQQILNRDVERIIKKQKITHKHIDEQLNTIIQELKMAQTPFQIQERLQAQKPLTKIINANKECYQYMSKLGKNMDKYGQKNVQYGQEEVELNSEQLIDLIKIHLLRDCQYDAYQYLVKETGQITQDLHDYFLENQHIIIEIKQKNLYPAIQWAIQNDNQPLVFQLYKQHFIYLVQTEGKEVAIKFARQNNNFSRFASSNMYEIQQLMTSLLFFDNIKESKYEYLYREENWQYILNMFLNESLKSQDLFNKSEIRTIFYAGALAMPKFIKYYQVSQYPSEINRRRQSEQVHNEIPIEIEIGKEYKFHSTFICPVTREICQPNNPPQLLKCGHVISKESAQKMLQNRDKFKCPTCPIVSTQKDIKDIIFM
ncbi:hypothetical protein pb186bvf_005477 [Paramecium bursaria]